MRHRAPCDGSGAVVTVGIGSAASIPGVDRSTIFGQHSKRLLAACIVLLSCLAPRSALTQARVLASPASSRGMTALPAYFEANRGQAASPVRFLARLGSSSLA